MASVSQNPYTTYKDCSQGICSIYCPQWCYFIFPPPPPFTIGDDGSDTTDFSPLIIAVIGILASAFILISYYTIISKYCRRRGGGGAGGQNSMELNDQNREQTPYASSGSGLDETLIKSITVCKYKKNDGFIEGTDCSICLSEFEEDESLRLLPKCSHAFHLPCIDPWLKAHASCPLCRANIASSNISPVQESAPPVQETNVSAQEYQHRIDDAVLVIQDLVGSVREEVVVVSLAAGDDDHVPQKDIEAQDHPIQPIGSSVSLNFPVCETQVPISISIADILCNSEEEDDDDGADEQVRDKGKKKSGILNMVRSSAEMKRSISTGRFMFTRYEKGRGSTIPN